MIIRRRRKFLKEMTNMSGGCASTLTRGHSKRDCFLTWGFQQPRDDTDCWNGLRVILVGISSTGLA